MPKVSIITPCYNSAPWIERTIDSVRAQTWNDWEHIVVDDGSSDESAAIVEKLARLEKRLRLIGQPNGGVCNARNNGAKSAHPDSEYLLFLDADDCLEPTMLETLIKHLQTHPRAALVCCSYVYIDNNDREMDTSHTPRWMPSLLGLRPLPENEPATPWISIFAGAPILASLSLLRRNIYEQSAGWDEHLGQHHEELDLFLRLAFLGEVHYLPDKLYRYRRRPGQSSDPTGQQERMQRQWQKFEAKWRNPQHLSQAQQTVVHKAWRFRAGRLAAHARVQAAHELLRRGKLWPATRLYAGAIERYIRYFHWRDCLMQSDPY